MAPPAQLCHFLSSASHWHLALSLFFPFKKHFNYPRSTRASQLNVKEKQEMILWWDHTSHDAHHHDDIPTHECSVVFTSCDNLASIIFTLGLCVCVCVIMGKCGPGDAYDKLPQRGFWIFQQVSPGSHFAMMTHTQGEKNKTATLLQLVNKCTKLTGVRCTHTHNLPIASCTHENNWLTAQSVGSSHIWAHCLPQLLNASPSQDISACSGC